METIERKDIQGLLLKGYGQLMFTQYLMLRVENAVLAKQWLGNIAQEIADGTQSPDQTSMNIAFTYWGLQALGMKEQNLRGFAREFREGIGEPHRQRLLGDLDSSSPDNWRWGGNAKDRRDEKNIHVLVLVYARTNDLLVSKCADLQAMIDANGLILVTSLAGQRGEDSKEPFGFRDGIAQPVIAGTGFDGNPENIVATGEFILGYENEYGVMPDTAHINPDMPQGDLSLLPVDPTGRKDLGRNGSYLVFRQIEQHVDMFWEYMHENSKNPDGSVNQEESIKLASKMVGRWPSGAPLATHPDKDPGGLSDEDDFGYHESDHKGLKCPIGSHIRRTNPRDAFEANSAKQSISLTKKHRIIRRGRAYSQSILDTDGSVYEEKGIHFLCFNVDFAKQFEFIQHTWANFPRFEHLHNDPDPLMSAVENPAEGEEQNFTIQAEPVNRCVKNLKRFVTIRGGAYFFFPSLTAVRYLSTI